MQIVVGTVIAGKYQLEAPLAQGGMGAVWVARHVKLASRLAVKFLDPRFAGSPAFIERFEREARAAAVLQSPHVVHVQDYGVDDGTPYLVMELLRGEDLSAKLNRELRLSLPETSRILLQLGKGLRKAHAAGIVHRDLKPANVFLAQVDDDEEVVKILDFGIAKETLNPIGEATKTGNTMGSPHYMSPEQARADKGIDHRADLWSLGIILYRMVTGILPFQGDAIGAVLSRILVDPVPPVAAAAPDLPAALDAFFAKALAKVKDNRFQSIQEMINAFTQIAGGSALLATGYVLPRVSVSEIAPSAPVAPEEPATLLLAPAAGQPGPRASGGSGTLTTTNMVQEPEVGARRRSAPWLAAAALIAILVGAVLFAWIRLRPVASNADPGPGTTVTPPSASAALTTETPSQPPSSPIQEGLREAAEPATGTTTSSGTSTAPTTVATANTTAAPQETGAPTSTAVIAPTGLPTSRPPKPIGTNRPQAPNASGPKKPGDEWGF